MFQVHLWEGRYWYWDRCGFLSGYCKAVVCGYEEVVSADVGIGIEWWAFGFDVFCQDVPLELGFVGEFSPGFDGSSVDAQLVYLVRCAREDGIRFCLVVAFSVSVVECDVAY